MTTPASTPETDFERLLRERGFVRRSRMRHTAWEGEIAGRRWVVSLSVLGRTRYVGEVRIRRRVGLRLRVEVATTVSTRLFFIREQLASNRVVSWIYRLKGYAVAAAGDALAEFRVVGPDVDWGRRLAAEPDACFALGELLRERATPQFAGSVYLTPLDVGGRLDFGSPTLQPVDLTTQRLEWLFDRLATVARAAERIPAPTVRTAPTRLERLGRERPWLAAVAVLGCGLGALGVIGLALVGIAVAMGR